MENTLRHTIVAQNGSYLEDNRQEMCADQWKRQWTPHLDLHVYQFCQIPLQPPPPPPSLSLKDLSQQPLGWAPNMITWLPDV